MLKHPAYFSIVKNTLTLTRSIRHNMDDPRWYPLRYNHFKILNFTQRCEIDNLSSQAR